MRTTVRTAVVAVILGIVLVVGNSMAAAGPRSLPVQETPYEEQVYQVMVAVTSPSLIHTQVGPFSFTPPANDNIYSLFKNLVRYGGLTNNYVDLHYGGEQSFDLVTRHTNAEGAITSINKYSNLFYVYESDVEAIGSARALWFRRSQWLLSTSPTRIYVESIPSGGNAGRVVIPVGENGSLIRNIFLSGYDAIIQFTIADIPRNATSSERSVYRVAGTDYNQHWNNGALMLPIARTIDGQAVTWNLLVYSANTTLGYVGYAIIEKFDLPDWWMG